MTASLLDAMHYAAYHAVDSFPVGNAKQGTDRRYIMVVIQARYRDYPFVGMVRPI